MSIDNKIYIRKNSINREFAVNSSIKIKIDNKKIESMLSKKAKTLFSNFKIEIGAKAGSVNQQTGESYSKILAFNKGDGTFENSKGREVPQRNIFKVIKLAKLDIIEYALSSWGNKKINIRNYRKFLETLARSAIRMIQIYVKANEVAFPAIKDSTIRKRITKTLHSDSPMFDTGGLLNAVDFNLVDMWGK